MVRLLVSKKRDFTVPRPPIAASAGTELKSKTDLRKTIDFSLEFGKPFGKVRCTKFGYMI
jgi:hypothetical protein